MRIQLIRSATLRIAVDDKTFLLDPWLAAAGEGRSYAGELRSPLVDLPLPISEVLAGVDAVLVSHLHSDHLDEVARTAIDPRTPVLSHDRDAADLRAMGFKDVRPISTGLDFGRVRIRTTAGRHGPPEVRAEMGDVSGFVLRAPGEPVLYLVGDSVLCPEVCDVFAAERPDVIVVHGCGATWGGVGPLVMDAGMILEALHLSAPATLVVTHMDAVDHATVSRADLRAVALDEPAAEGRLLIPDDGESLDFAGCAGNRGRRRSMKSDDHAA